MSVRIFLISIFVVLSGCSEPMPSSEGNVTINIATPTADGAASAPDETLAGVLLTTAYPHLGAVTMTVFDVGQDLNISASVNRDYNGNRFGSVAAADLFYRGDDAFYVVDSTFSLNVPNDTDLSFTITAFNVSGYQIYSATAQLTAAQIAAGSSSLPMAMVVDIDPTVPVQFSVTGCLDSDGDDFCDTYEDLFFRLNCPNPADPAELNDVDCDDLSNKFDPDSDGDGVTDDIDGLAPSNDGFPSFIHINNDPTSVSLDMVTDMGIAVTGYAVVADVDAGDCHSIGIATQPTNGVAQILAGGAIDPNDPYACVFYGVNYTPNPSFVGSDSFTITARDRVGDALNSPPITGTVNVTVNGVNTPPVASAQSLSLDEDASVVITLIGSDLDDPNGSSLSYTLVSTPVNGVLTGTAPVLTYTPNANFSGTDSLSFTVSDGVDVSAVAVVDITVVSVNDAPVISGVPTTSVNEDSIYIFTPSASDVDVGDNLTFSIVNQPAWASFNTATGELIGTPANADVGTTTGIIITVTDDAATPASASLAAFDLTVANTNDAPTISGTPATSVNEDSAYSFIPTAGDVDVGDTLTFSIVNQPSWATFNTATGELSGTPVNADVGTTTGIIITVTDDAATPASASLAAFDLTVVNINDAPTISGTPATSVNEDSAYSFIPTAGDVDVGDTLTFSIVNQPSWATFNTATGELSGTPVNADVGTTTGIIITVTDDAATPASASLAAFDLTVVNTNDAPVANADTAITVDYVGLIIDLVANDTDVDGDALSISAVDGIGTNGGYITDIGSGRVFYEPINATAGDSFTYTVSDGNGGTANGSVTVTINLDGDADGLSDTDEATAGTDPGLADHDGDGFVDGHEIAAGSDPLINASTPAGTVISSADGSNVISGDVVWDLAGSPYWVQENVSVVSGGNLIIEPFVTVKYAVGTTTHFVYPGGTMRVFGAPGSASYVTFTSELDDSVQGDTSGNGASTGSPGDWARIEFAGGDGEINYTNMRYGNTTLWIRDSSPDVLVLNANNCGAYCVYISSSDSGVTTAPTLSSLFLETPATGAQHAISIVNGTGANTLSPAINGFNTIDLLDALDIGIYVDGVGAIPMVDGTGGSNPIEITGGGYGISVNNGAAGTFRGLQIMQAATSGVRFNTTGAPVLENSELYLNGSVTSYGGGIDVTAAATGTAIDNNVIRGNFALAGGGIYQASANEFPIRNNLIIDNVAYLNISSAGGGIYLGANSVTALLHNTLSGNYTEANMGGGLYVADNATLTMSENILWGNYDMCDGACPGDFEVGTSVIINSSYNLIGDSGSYTFIGAGDIYADPLFVRNWYLDNVLATSPAIDPVGAAITLPSYLLALTTPTTVVAGTVDASGGDTVDMGYHHTSAAPVVDETQSSVSSGVITGSPQTANILVIPMDASGQWLGAGQDVWIDFTANQGSSFTGGTVCDVYAGWISGTGCPLVDNGDGTYEITYDNTATWCTSACAETVQITVNGVAFTTKTITYTYDVLLP